MSGKPQLVVVLIADKSDTFPTIFYDLVDDMLEYIDRELVFVFRVSSFEQVMLS
jgi:hypothetical protein